MANPLTPEEIQLSTMSAKNQMAFQERMSNTAYTRAMSDMKNAGLNPVLVGKLGPASTPTGAEGDYSGSEIVSLLNSSLNTTAKAVDGLRSALTSEEQEKKRKSILDLLKFYIPPSSRDNDFTTEEAMSQLNARQNAFYDSIGLDTSYDPKTSKLPLMKGSNAFATFLLNTISQLSNQNPFANLYGSAFYTFSGKKSQDVKEVAKIAEANGQKLVKRPGGDYIVVTPKKTESTAKRLWNNFKTNWRNSVKASFG